jgi:hypothetical protein
VKVHQIFLSGGPVVHQGKKVSVKPCDVEQEGLYQNFKIYNPRVVVFPPGEGKHDI